MNTKIIKILSGFLFAALLMLSCDNNIDPWLAEQATEARKGLPVIIEKDVMTLDKVDALSGNVFQYEYSMLNVENLASTSQFEQEVKAESIQTLQTTSGINEFRNRKVTIVFIYKNKHGKHIAKVKIKPSEY